MSISNVDLECGVGHRLNDSAFHFDHVGFCQVLSLLVLITAAYRGDGFTKLTICDGFVASDPLGNRAPIAPEQRRVFAPLALRPFHGPRLSVRQQEEVPLRRKDEEGLSLIPAGGRCYDIRFHNVHITPMTSPGPSEAPALRR